MRRQTLRNHVRCPQAYCVHPTSAVAQTPFGSAGAAGPQRREHDDDLHARAQGGGRRHRQSAGFTPRGVMRHRDRPNRPINSTLPGGNEISFLQTGRSRRAPCGRPVQARRSRRAPGPSRTAAVHARSSAMACRAADHRRWSTSRERPRGADRWSRFDVVKQSYARQMEARSPVMSRRFSRFMRKCDGSASAPSRNKAPDSSEGTHLHWPAVGPRLDRGI
jgi:hypothetical protein